MIWIFKLSFDEDILEIFGLATVLAAFPLKKLGVFFPIFWSPCFCIRAGNLQRRRMVDYLSTVPFRRRLRRLRLRLPSRRRRIFLPLRGRRPSSGSP